MRKLFFLCIVLNLVACTATTKTNVRNEAEAERFDPASMARIRLITGDQMIKGGYVSGFSCEKFFNEATANRPAEEVGWKPAREDSTGIPPLRASDKQNNVIGMPESKATKVINESKFYYDEYAVPANRPLIVRFTMGGPGSVYCSPKPVVFTPQAGKDYELQYEYLRLQNNQPGCILAVRRLNTIGTAVLETPIAPQYCSEDGQGGYKTLDPFQGREHLRMPEASIIP